MLALERGEGSLHHLISWLNGSKKLLSPVPLFLPKFYETQDCMYS